MSLVKSLAFVSLLALGTSAAPLTKRALSCPASDTSMYTVGSSNYVIECGTDRVGGDMPAPNGLQTADLEACIAQCQMTNGCILVDYKIDVQACYLKSTVETTSANTDVIGARLVAANAVASALASIPTVAAALVASPSATASVGMIGASTGKRGLAFNLPSLTSLFGGSGSKVTWSYNWDQKASGVSAGVIYIPMLWSNSADRVATWAASATAAIAAGADAILAFNEPDLPAQANMAVGTAVSAWKANMEPFAKQVRLGAPAVTNGPAPAGLTYLSTFISSCTDCNIAFCPIHWYDSATNVAYFKSYVGDAITACGNKPIWITEFGASGSADQVATFLDTVLPWLDANAMVERYAYFMTAPSSDGTYLVNSAGSGLSTIGNVFNSA